MTPRVPDAGHRFADKELTALMRRINVAYKRSSISLRQKVERYMDQFEKEDAAQRARYDSGELSHDDYMAWRYRKIAGTKQWRDMLGQITTDLTRMNQNAAALINDTLPGVYAENHNYGTYEAESGSGVDTTYTMYDKDTVSRLLQGNPDLLPQPTVNIPKDQRWNRQHVQSEVLQGILQGEPMRDIAGRLMSVTDMSARAAMRNARTAITGAENAGRIDSYLRAQSMGIKMKQVWMAALDSRTRDSHALLDGEKQDPGKRFSNGCRYPGDPEGKPAEIYNCRCTLVAEVEGSDAYDESDLSARANRLDVMSYEQWKEIHEERFNRAKFNDRSNQVSITSGSTQIIFNKSNNINAKQSYRNMSTDISADNVPEIVQTINLPALSEIAQRAYDELQKGGHVSFDTIKEIFGNSDEVTNIIAHATGTNTKEASEFLKSITAYAGNEHRAIRHYQQGRTTDGDEIEYIKPRAEALEKFINRSPKWKGGTTYRAVGLSDADLNDIIQKIDNKVPISMDGTSSWSSSKDVANTWDVYKSNKVVYICDTQSKGASIAGYSNIPLEYEVLVSDDARYNPVKYWTENEITYVQLEEIHE